MYAILYYHFIIVGTPLSRRPSKLMETTLIKYCYYSRTDNVIIVIIIVLCCLAFSTTYATVIRRNG